MKHSKSLKAFVAAGTICMIVLGGAASAWAAPAQHFDQDVTGGVFVCATHTYTITSGVLKSVFHEGESKSGNTNFTGTLTPKNVVLEDENGDPYRLSGAVWFGETSNGQRGSAQGTFTAYINILDQNGGVVDRVAQTAHFSSDGRGFFLDNGTCLLPEL